jgi:RNA polymerase sigma-70 factor (sigma-E family)
MTDGFEEWVLARGDALHRTAFLLTRDHALAEDLVQTALAKAWPAWRRIHTDPEQYVRRAMLNTYSSWWRRRWNGERPTADLPDRPGWHGADHGDDVATRAGVLAALDALPRRQRAVVVLRYFEDLTEAQTADVLGISVGTVKSQSRDALRRLREEVPGLADVRISR